MEIRRKNGANTAKIHKNLKIGLYGLSKEQRIQNSKKMVEEKRGWHKLSKKEKSLRSKERSKNDLKNKTGLFSLTSEDRSKIAKKTNLQKWKCTVTGYISNAGGLSNYQKNKNIDKSCRIRIR